MAQLHALTLAQISQKSSRNVHPGWAQTAQYMTDEEAFHAFLSVLVTHLQEHVGAHVQDDLEKAMAMAQRLEANRGGGEGAKASGSKGSRKFKKQNK